MDHDDGWPGWSEHDPDAAQPPTDDPGGADSYDADDLGGTDPYPAGHDAVPEDDATPPATGAGYGDTGDEPGTGYAGEYADQPADDVDDATEPPAHEQPADPDGPAPHDGESGEHPDDAQSAEHPGTAESPAEHAATDAAGDGEHPAADAAGDGEVAGADGHDSDSETPQADHADTDGEADTPTEEFGAGLDSAGDHDGSWHDDEFPAHLDFGADTPQPHDGYPWSDPETLGQPETGDVFDGGLADTGPADPQDLLDYAGLEAMDGANPWEQLLASEDPATSALARWWGSAG